MMDLMLESVKVYRTLICFKNHSSSCLDPLFINSYIANKQAANWYSRGYVPKELKHTIGPFYTSPIGPGLVPKPYSSNLCMIQDMSYP